MKLEPAYPGVTDEQMKVRIPSIIPPDFPEGKKQFCWLYEYRMPRYEAVDWDRVTPEEMEEWRKELARLKL